MTDNRTAVEWLEQQLKLNLKKIILEGDSKLMEVLFERAKEMERSQISCAYNNSKTAVLNEINEKTAKMYYRNRDKNPGLEYYKENYGK